MTISRRSFLKKTGLLAAGASVATLPFLTSCGSRERDIPPFGLQLYTLRDVMPDDPVTVLRELADMGYKQIESYEGPMGMFWGMENTEFRSLMDDLDMTIISSHANVFDDLERKVEEAAEIGMKYIVCPWIGPQDSMDDYRQIADQFNEIGEVANSAGIKFAYHNHEYTFEEMDGELPQDVLMERTDESLVEYQMDIYWFAAGNQDPAEWIRRYPGRFTSSHVKDIQNGDDHESVVLGTGSINFEELLPLAKENGMEYFIVEQEAYTNTTPMEAVQANAIYMQELMREW
ncbi:MAG: TIM barrel protein [Balneolaceae bacterium]|nr:TIM barrel protein [Balneolaceae bacterium]MCH8548000.1 TIM barrel protein [Balneolaceae bacterium]